MVLDFQTFESQETKVDTRHALNTNFIGDHVSAHFRRKRLVAKEYPTSALKSNVPETFEIRKVNKPYCGLFKGSQETSMSYMVLKIDNEYGDKYSNFYVVPGPEFERVESDDPDDEQFLPQSRYKDQIGFAVCQSGWLERVCVNSGKGNTDDSNDDCVDEYYSDVALDARRCGIASVLTELCLIDPKINKIDPSSSAFEHLREHDSDDIEDDIARIETKCENLVGLEMAAEPKVAAYGYLSAALRLEYLELIVQERFFPEDPRICWKELSISYYKTQEAKELFNAETGMIAPCGSNRLCNAYEGYWYFCKENTGIHK